MKSSKFISSSETMFCKQILPCIACVVAASLFLFGKVAVGVVVVLFAIVNVAVFWRMQHVELSMGRIRIHRRGEDVWIDYADIKSIEPRTPLRGYEAAVLHLNRKSVLGRRIWFLLERRYMVSPPVVRSRPVHPTISSMRGTV